MRVEELRERKELLTLQKSLLLEKLELFLKETEGSVGESITTLSGSDFNLGEIDPKALLVEKINSFIDQSIEEFDSTADVFLTSKPCIGQKRDARDMDKSLFKTFVLTSFLGRKRSMKDDLESIGINVNTGGIDHTVPETDSSRGLARLKELQKESMLPSKTIKSLKSLKMQTSQTDYFAKPFLFKYSKRELSRFIEITKTGKILEVCKALEDLPITDLLQLSSYDYFNKNGYNNIIESEIINSEDVSRLIDDYIQSLPLERAPVILNYILNLSPELTNVVRTEKLRDSAYFFLLEWVTGTVNSACTALK